MECRPVVVAAKTRPNDEQLSPNRELYDRRSCVEVPNIAAYAHQDVDRPATTSLAAGCHHAFAFSVERVENGV